LQFPPKFTQIVIFGMKIKHLATLERRPLLAAESCDQKKDRFFGAWLALYW
jgi:hypothetical protein